MEGHWAHNPKKWCSIPARALKRIQRLLIDFQMEIS